MDNCDEFFKINKSQFIMNLIYLKSNFDNLTLILISQEKLDPSNKLNFMPI